MKPAPTQEQSITEGNPWNLPERRNRIVAGALQLQATSFHYKSTMFLWAQIPGGYGSVKIRFKPVKMQRNAGDSWQFFWSIWWGLCTNCTCSKWWSYRTGIAGFKGKPVISEMKTLIAIGGGSFQKQETMSIDTYAILGVEKHNHMYCLFR